MHNITSIVLRARDLDRQYPMAKLTASHKINDEPPHFFVISKKRRFDADLGVKKEILKRGSKKMN
jgi:hypothetical protein